MARFKIRNPKQETLISRLRVIRGRIAFFTTDITDGTDGKMRWFAASWCFLFPAVAGAFEIEVACSCEVGGGLKPGEKP